MGKRARRRGKSAGPAADVRLRGRGRERADAARARVGGTASKLREPAGGAAASVDDLWRRRTELLFERFAVSWTIAGLPLTGQKELLGRYRMADQVTQQWVRETLDRHVREHQPELAE